MPPFELMIEKREDFLYNLLKRNRKDSEKNAYSMFCEAQTKGEGR